MVVQAARCGGSGGRIVPVGSFGHPRRQSKAKAKKTAKPQKSLRTVLEKPES